MNRQFESLSQLMVQGTTSDAGKSTLVTGLCRVLQRAGVRVAPFKPQNMALNSAVTDDGGEIGRAQAVQAMAAGVAPSTDMNPVLLKPNSDTGAQIIIHGRAVCSLEAPAYHEYKTIAMQAVLESYERLRQKYQSVITEGAGSPAEINLRDRDIANMGFAETVDCPVVLIADIDKGGVFAHLVGTLSLLSESEQARIVGFVINRFRGDISLLQPGLEWLEAYTGKPVLGVLPYLHDLHLEAEDAIQSESRLQTSDQTLEVVVPVLTRLSNHTDFDVLRLHPQVNLRYIGAGQSLPPADVVMIPGSKSVIADLQHLRDQGWDRDIARHLRYGGKLLGICGGFQMLGRAIADPLGIEGRAESVAGLGYLAVDTELQSQKELCNRTGTLVHGGAVVTGYEIHCGKTVGEGLQLPVIAYRTDHGDLAYDGARSDDDQIMGTYWHGLFDSPQAMEALLQWCGLRQMDSFDYDALRQSQIDRLADTLEEHMDSGFLRALMG